MLKICLCMIVKDEAHVIKRCIDSVKSIIDYWVISDTGSEDATKEIIIAYMHELGIPGELIERPWKNFAHNRSEVLEYARDKAEYSIVIDADEVYKIDPAFDKSKLTFDSYEITVEYGALSYATCRFFKNSLPWRYEGVIHNYPTVENSQTRGVLKEIKTSTRRDGARSVDPHKEKKDIAILQQALADKPDDARYTFYLAQTYRESRQNELAIHFYQKRVELGGWHEEIFYSLYRIGTCMQSLGKPWKDVLEAYLDAWEYRPNRVEPLYEILAHYRRSGNFFKGYLFGKMAQAIVFPSDRLFVHKPYYDFAVIDELSICAYRVGRFAESIELCDKLLSDGHIPDDYQERVNRNKEFSVQKLKEISTQNRG